MVIDFIFAAQSPNRLALYMPIMELQEHRKIEVTSDESSWGNAAVLLPICDWRKRWRGIVVARPWGRVEEMKLGSVEDGHGGIDGSLSRPRVR
jgi:hypothetical protein